MRRSTRKRPLTRSCRRSARVGSTRMPPTPRTRGASQRTRRKRKKWARAPESERRSDADASLHRYDLDVTLAADDGDAEVVGVPRELQTDRRDSLREEGRAKTRCAAPAHRCLRRATPPASERRLRPPRPAAHTQPDTGLA